MGEEVFNWRHSWQTSHITRNAEKMCSIGGRAGIFPSNSPCLIYLSFKHFNKKLYYLLNISWCVFMLKHFSLYNIPRPKMEIFHMTVGPNYAIYGQRWFISQTKNYIKLWPWIIKYIYIVLNPHCLQIYEEEKNFFINSLHFLRNFFKDCFWNVFDMY